MRSSAGARWLLALVCVVACGGRSALSGGEVGAAGATVTSGAPGGATTGGAAASVAGSAATGGSESRAGTGAMPATGSGGTSSGAGRGTGGAGGASVSGAGGGSSGLSGGPGDVAGAAGSSDSDCVVRVATSGNDENDGSSWLLALHGLQRGLDAASALLDEATCSTVEIWVAAGTYQPTPGTDRTQTFRLLSGVALYGGFAGTESARDERDVAAHPCILSGEIGAPGDNSDNSYHVVTGATGATLDGFQIAWGCANGTGADLRGAGMYNAAASPTVANCTFANNLAGTGAGMYNDASSPSVTNTTFENNEVEFGDGAGMANENGASPVVVNSTFKENKAQYLGGGMYNDDSSPTVTHCVFLDNGAESGGGMQNVQASPVITDCAFAGNGAYGGGAMSNFGSSTTLSSSTFLGNSAYLGGALEDEDSSLTLEGCTFTSNVVSGTAEFTGEAQASGGGMYNALSSVTLTNCVFADNSAAYAGGGLFDQDGSSTVTSCTFTGNSAGSSGGGLHNEISTPVVTNSIFWGDTVGTSVGEIADADASASTVVSHSIVEGGYSGTAVITGDPHFVDAASGDLRLAPASPAIDAGDGCESHVTLLDQAGAARWDIQAVPNAVDALDLGAFEYQGTPGVDTPISDFACPQP